MEMWLGKSLSLVAGHTVDRDLLIFDFIHDRQPESLRHTSPVRGQSLCELFDPVAKQRVRPKIWWHSICLYPEYMIPPTVVDSDVAQNVLQISLESLK